MGNYKKIIAGVVMVACLWVTELTNGQVVLDAELIAKAAIEVFGLFAIYQLRNTGA